MTPSSNGSLAIRKANIITMDSRRPRADALVIRQGKIVAVGKWEAVAPYAEGLQEFNLVGKTVLPGFIDSHVHLTWTGLKAITPDFSEANTVEDVQSIVHEALLKTPPNQIICGMGFNLYQFPKGGIPTLEDLDQVAPHHPLLITGITGHYSLVNTQCLKKLNFSSDVPGSDPNGLLSGQANSIALKTIHNRCALEQGLEVLHRSAAEEAIAAGLTTVHALEGEDQPNDPMVSSLVDRGSALPLRVIIWYQTTDVVAVKEQGLPRAGGCILLDGDFGPHTAALLEPYADQPDNKGTLYYSQEEINLFVEAAHRAGLQIAMHAVGDRAVEQALKAYERALTLFPRKDHRHRIEHFEIYDQRLVESAKQLGIILAIQPAFNVYFGGHIRLNPILGEERALRSDPLGSLIDFGLRVGGGSDSTVTPMEPLYGVYSCVNHSNPSERIDVERALQLYTLDNAFLAFEENERGSAEVGKAGDLVVLSDDPTMVSPEAIKDIVVEMTVVEGEVVYSR